MDEADRLADFEATITRNQARILAIARSYADQEAEDLFQEILMQAWRSFARFEARSSADTWLYRIALNTAISWSRAKRCRPTLQQVETEVFDKLVARERDIEPTAMLERFIKQLPDLDRALILMYLADLSNLEIAETLGITANHVRVRLHRLKEQFVQWSERE